MPHTDTLYPTLDWTLSRYGSVLMHRTPYGDVLHIVENSDNVETVLAECEKKWADAKSSADLAKKDKKTVIKLVNRILAVIAIVFLVITAVTFERADSPTFDPLPYVGLLIATIATVVLYVLNLRTLNSPPYAIYTTFADRYVNDRSDQDLEKAAWAINDRLKDDFPIHFIPKHPSSFMAHMTPDHVREVICAYSESPAVGDQLLDVLDEKYTQYDAGLEQKKRRIRKNASDTPRDQAVEIADSLLITTPPPED